MITLPKFQMNQPKDVLLFVASIFLVVLTIVSVVATVALANASRQSSRIAERTITVSASAEAYATPDIAQFTFAVVERGADVAAIQSTGTTRANAIIEKLQALGIDKKDIQSQSVQVMPQYEWRQTACRSDYCPGGKQVLTGYEFSHSVMVTVRDFALTGKVLQLLGDSQVDNLYGPNFTFDDPDAAKDSARTEAAQKAREKAKALADAMGVRLGKVVSFSEDGGAYPLYARGGVAEMAVSYDAAAVKVATPTIEPGQNKVTTTVTVTFRIR